MNSKSRIIALLLALTLVFVFALTACTSDSPSTGDPTPAEDPTPGGEDPTPGGEDPTPGGEDPTPDDPASDLSGTLEVWNIWTNPIETNAKAWDEVLQAYKDSHPNVTVEVTSTENEAFKTQIVTSMSADEIPDVFFGWGPAQIQPFVEAGKILALDEYLDDEYMSTVADGSLDSFTFDGKVYGLSMYQWAGTFYCNEEMFAQVGAALPTTYELLLDAIEKFKAEGIVPIAVGGKDGWPAMFFQNIMAIRTAGAPVIQEMLEGTRSFNDPAIVKSAQYVLDLVELGAFDPGTLALSEGDAAAMFNQGQSPMYYLGEWMAAGFNDPDVSTVGGKVVAMNFPAIPDAVDNTHMLGGATDCFCVAADTADKELAADFVKYVTKAMSEKSFEIGGTTPTRIFDQAPYLDGIDEVSKQIADFSGASTGKVLAWDTFLVGADAEAHKSLCQQLFAGSITAEAFAEEMAKLQEG